MTLMAVIWPVWGMVKNGVVVPHNPLPEGALVRIMPPPEEPVEFTPEEQAEFDAWAAAGAQSLALVERLAEEGEDDATGEGVARPSA
jgi:hypothetical protein